MTQYRQIVATICGLIMSVAASTAWSGPLEFDFGAATFTDPTTVDNDYWPLSSLASAVYFSESSDGCEVNQVVVSGATRSGFGVPYDDIEAIIVQDREWVDEECTGDYVLAEETEDWFAQDDAGNIWYLGEDTIAWDDEEDCLSTGGAWEAGEDGAQAGVVILGSPRVGQSYQQEFYEGEAEDRAKVLRLGVPVSIEFGDYDGCMKTKEYTPLEPGGIEHKYYCRLSQGGLGLMLIEELKGKTKIVEYVGTTRPAGLPDDFPTAELCGD
jgi:hypothetical protein